MENDQLLGCLPLVSRSATPIVSLLAENVLLADSSRSPKSGVMCLNMRAGTTPCAKAGISGLGPHIGASLWHAKRGMGSSPRTRAQRKRSGQAALRVKTPADCPRAPDREGAG